MNCLGQKPCFLGPIQPVRRKVKIHYYIIITNYILHLSHKINQDFWIWKNLPGAQIVTPLSPSIVGPRLVHVYVFPGNFSLDKKIYLNLCFYSHLNPNSSRTSLEMDGTLNIAKFLCVLKFPHCIIPKKQIFSGKYKLLLFYGAILTTINYC